MPTNIAKPPPWRCQNQERAEQLLLNVFKYLKIEVEAERKFVYEKVDDIVRSLQQDQEREDASAGLGEPRKVFSKLSSTSLQLRRQIRQALIHLELGFGGATDTFSINPDQDNPKRRSLIAEQKALEKRWASLDMQLRKLERDTDKYIESWKEPKGGNLSVAKMQFGPAKRNFVKNCHDLFEQFLPNAASKSGDGDFHEMCIAIYELATGELADLQYYVRQIIDNKQENK